jgi:hypothetical protein
MPASATKRFLIAVVVLVCLAAAAVGFYLHRASRPLPAAAANPGAAPTVLSELPLDAPGVAYVDVAALRKLQGSPLAAVLGLAGANPESDRDYANFVRATGFDYTRDLDKATLAFWLAGNVAQQNLIQHAVTVAEGRFDRPKIQAYALRTGHVISRANESVYEVPGDPPVALEFLSPSRIALASGKNPTSLLGPFPSKPRDPLTQSLIDRVSGAPLFAVLRADNLPPSFYDIFRNYPQLEQLARNIQGLTLAGQPKATDLNLVLDAQCDSMPHAMELSTVLDGLRMLGSMALADPKTRAQMSREQLTFLNAVLRQATITHQDRWVRLTLDVTPAMLGSSGAD